MADALPPLRKEAMPPRSGDGFYGPIAALATVMMLSIASLVAVTAPHPRRACPHAPRSITITPVPPEVSARAAAPVALEGPDSPCRGPVFRASPDGKAEVTYEVCATARPIRIVE